MTDLDDRLARSRSAAHQAFEDRWWHVDVLDLVFDSLLDRLPDAVAAPPGVRRLCFASGPYTAAVEVRSTGPATVVVRLWTAGPATVEAWRHDGSGPRPVGGGRPGRPMALPAGLTTLVVLRPGCAPVRTAWLCL